MSTKSLMSEVMLLLHCDGGHKCGMNLESFHSSFSVEKMGKFLPFSLSFFSKLTFQPMDKITF